MAQIDRFKSTQRWTNDVEESKDENATDEKTQHFDKYNYVIVNSQKKLYKWQKCHEHTFQSGSKF